MHQVDVNWRPRFLPLVELLLLFPPSLLRSFFLRTNATFLPSVICSADSPSGPWRTPPSNLSTPGGGLFTQCWLGVPWTALATFHPSFLTPMLIHSSPSFFSTIHNPPYPQTTAIPLCGSCALPAHPSVAVWSSTVGQGIGLLRQQGCKSVAIFTSLPEEPTARAGLWLCGSVLFSVKWWILFFSERPCCILICAPQIGRSRKKPRMFTFSNIHGWLTCNYIRVMNIFVCIVCILCWCRPKNEDLKIMLMQLC